MQMLRAKCAACSWIFDVVTLPMSAEAACKTMIARSACPMCGNIKNNMTDEPRDLSDQEERHKSTLIGLEPWR